MRRISIVSYVLGASLLALFPSACSDDEGSTVSGNPPNGKAGATSGGSSSAGTPSVLPGAGTAGSGGGAGTGMVPTDACPGLPIVGSEPPMTGGAGGAPNGTAGESAGGADGGTGAGGEAFQMEPAAGAGGGEGACLGVSLEAEALEVDMFIMMDRSQSMGYLIEGTNMTRWDALREAVQDFVQDPNAADIGGGIGFFSLSGIGDDNLDCDVSDYATPAVPIGSLADVGADLVAAIDDITPAGLTPTVPALQGAIEYATQYHEDHPERATIVVLVSDGYPTQCETAPDQIAAAAKVGYESAAHIRTFVIGVGDVARFNLDNYARAGGTQKAFLTDAANVSSTFVDALNNITDSKLACEYRIPEPPDGQLVDVDEVQVVYTPSGDGSEEVPRVNSFADCASAQNGGWYYDNPTMPTKITVCPCSCARLQAGNVEVRLGCKPRIGIR